MLYLRSRESLPRDVAGGSHPSGEARELGYSRMKAWISSGVALPSLLASTLSKIRL